MQELQPTAFCMQLQLHAVASVPAPALGFSSGCHPVGQGTDKHLKRWLGSSLPRCVTLTIVGPTFIFATQHSSAPTHLTRHAHLPVVLGFSDSGSGSDDLLRTKDARAQHRQR